MYRFEEHTGEVRVRLQGQGVGGLLAQAGLALAEVLTGGPVGPPSRREAERPIELEARDREGILVDWLNELIYLTDTTGRIFTGYEFASVDDGHVAATAWGEVPETTQTAVKAATYHGLAIRDLGGGQLEAEVILDV